MRVWREMNLKYQYSKEQLEDARKENERRLLDKNKISSLVKKYSLAEKQKVVLKITIFLFLLFIPAFMQYEFFRPLSYDKVINDFALINLALIPGAFLVIFLYLKKYKVERIVFYAVLFLAVLSVPTGLTSIALLFNAIFCPGPEHSENFLVTRKYIDFDGQKGNSRDYKLILRVNKDSRIFTDAEKKIQVSPFEYRRTTPGKTLVKIGIRPGKLGYRWISKTKVLKNISE